MRRELDSQHHLPAHRSTHVGCRLRVRQPRSRHTQHRPPAAQRPVLHARLLHGPGLRAGTLELDDRTVLLRDRGAAQPGRAARRPSRPGPASELPRLPRLPRRQVAHRRPRRHRELPRPLRGQAPDRCRRRRVLRRRDHPVGGGVPHRARQAGALLPADRHGQSARRVRVRARLRGDADSRPGGAGDPERRRAAAAAGELPLRRAGNHDPPRGAPGRRLPHPLADPAPYALLVGAAVALPGVEPVPLRGEGGRGDRHGAGRPGGHRPRRRHPDPVHGRPRRGRRPASDVPEVHPLRGEHPGAVHRRLPRCRRDASQGGPRPRALHLRRGCVSHRMRLRRRRAAAGAAGPQHPSSAGGRRRCLAGARLHRE